MLLKKGRYGLKALVDLNRLAPGQTAFVNEMAIHKNNAKTFLDTPLGGEPCKTRAESAIRTTRCTAGKP